jgi:hypothetical protein
MKLVVLFFLLNSIAVFGQTDFKVVKLKRPKDAIYPFSQIEPSIAINPLNSREMAAGSVLSDFYYSRNGGKRWKSRTIESKYGVFGDPVLMFDFRNRLYYFHLASFVETSHLDRIVCQSTNKVSKSFNEGTFPEPEKTKVQDKQWTVVNPINNEIYMTWTQFDAYDSGDPKDTSIIVFSKSMDQGATWSKPIKISSFTGDCKDDDDTVEGAVPAVGPNGEIYVTWTGPAGLVFQKSLDGGNTWLPEERKIEKHYGGWTLAIPGIYRANGLPILKCDNSNGPNRGTIYLNWCDQRNGETDTDSWLVKSKDGGETWSEPIKVNQDDSKNHQFFTWMTIDQSSGFLYFVYYDRRNYNDTKTDVYVSSSRDGGESFVDTRVSEKPFTPNPNLFFGDYLNIDAVNGEIRPIWPIMENDKIELFVAILKEAKLKK